MATRTRKPKTDMESAHIIELRDALDLAKARIMELEGMLMTAEGQRAQAHGELYKWQKTCKELYSAGDSLRSAMAGAERKITRDEMRGC